MSFLLLKFHTAQCGVNSLFWEGESCLFWGYRSPTAQTLRSEEYDCGAQSQEMEILNPLVSLGRMFNDRASCLAHVIKTHVPPLFPLIWTHTGRHLDLHAFYSQ